MLAILETFFMAAGDIWSFFSRRFVKPDHPLWLRTLETGGVVAVLLLILLVALLLGWIVKSAFFALADAIR